MYGYPPVTRGEGGGRKKTKSSSRHHKTNKEDPNLLRTKDSQAVRRRKSLSVKELLEGYTLKRRTK